MRLHERTIPVERAEIEFRETFRAWQQKHDLTFGETFRILGNLMAREATYMVRQERHGEESDKRADEA
jgi:hypothetical protein